MIWKVEFDDAAVKELRKLDHSAQQDILRYFRERIASDEDPRRFGKQLSHDLSNLSRYRMICHIADEKPTVLVLTIGHRKDVYK
ncbi:MAG: type II toxin-antitoxin system RelE/ParE family toxin [Nitrosomonas sp.]|uniref:type II toxin-antitoxin system RelE family toxin n=1 Tax=Nitrosomonas sp. TaxID=42353 RepID=UPI001DF21342|nr:type II toxin-antitoxin system RelE/ParE family toxin [Nitrosomonas sp.]MBX9893705.1 type II toxin-antitoxin system RelE/ParE family toxin [Nitrosomonas sp.]